jgi:CelD/BcsL family acetyltransferase involved in cellulose biosynthesis
MSLSEKLFYFDLAPPSWSLPAWLKRAGSARLPAVHGLEAQWHGTWPEDARLSGDIRRLLKMQQAPTAFQSSAWQKALSWPYSRARRYHLLTLHDGDDFAGLLPLWRRQSGVLEVTGSMVSDYLEPVFGGRDARRMWTACLRALEHVPGAGVRRLVLHNIRRECFDYESLAAAAKEAGFRASMEENAVISRIPLAATWDQYLAGLSPHDRKELRRKLRNAETKAGAQLVVAQGKDDVPAALDKTFTFMRQGGWTKSMKVQWAYRPLFSRAACDLVCEGWLEVYMLRLEGRDVAGLICFPSPIGPQLWGAGFDATARNWSPGIVLFGMAIRRAIEGGARYFDLMRGEARYKNNLGSVDSPIYRVTLEKVGA